MGLKQSILTIIALILFYSCDDELKLIKKSNYSNKIKLNGYYSYIEDETISIFFFYKNGVVRYAGSCNISELEGYELAIKDDNSKINKMPDVRFLWGLYEINENKIILERWMPSARPHKTVTYNGIILNDSTFIIKNSSYNGIKYDLDEVHKFKEFEPKLDSVTKFIN